jgi:hypothetical protein
MHKKLVIIGALIIAVAGISPFIYDKYFDYRIPADWSWQAKYLGDSAFPDETGNFSSKRSIAVNQRTQKLLSWGPDKAIIADDFTVTDVNSGAIVYQSKVQWEVDPKTGQHIKGWGAGKGVGLPFLFPRHAEKKDYRVFNYYLEPFTARFDRVEEVNGLTTYVYKFDDELDATDSYKGTGEYPGVKPGPGQTVVFSKILLEYWVEPSTGEIVKSVEDSAGDYVIDIKTRKLLIPLSAWTANMADDSVYRQVQLLNNRMVMRSYYTVWVPTVAAIIGLIFVVVGVIGMYRKKPAGSAA